MTHGVIFPPSMPAFLRHHHHHHQSGGSVKQIQCRFPKQFFKCPTARTSNSTDNNKLAPNQRIRLNGTIEWRRWIGGRLPTGPPRARLPQRDSAQAGLSNIGNLFALASFPCSAVSTTSLGLFDSRFERTLTHTHSHTHGWSVANSTFWDVMSHLYIVG